MGERKAPSFAPDRATGSLAHASCMAPHPHIWAALIELRATIKKERSHEVGRETK